MTRQRYCDYCDDYRPFELEKPSHVLHLLLSIVTVGWWVPVWALVAVHAGRARGHCRECGS